jgi:hypothetical protein
LRAVSARRLMDRSAALPAAAVDALTVADYVSCRCHGKSQLFDWDEVSAKVYTTTSNVCAPKCNHSDATTCVSDENGINRSHDTGDKRWTRISENIYSASVAINVRRT